MGYYYQITLEEYRIEQERKTNYIDNHNLSYIATHRRRCGIPIDRYGYRSLYDLYYQHSSRESVMSLNKYAEEPARIHYGFLSERTRCYGRKVRILALSDGRYFDSVVDKLLEEKNED